MNFRFPVFSKEFNKFELKSVKTVRTSCVPCGAAYPNGARVTTKTVTTVKNFMVQRVWTSKRNLTLGECANWMLLYSKKQNQQTVIIVWH